MLVDSTNIYISYGAMICRSNQKQIAWRNFYGCSGEQQQRRQRDQPQLQVATLIRCEALHTAAELHRGSSSGDRWRAEQSRIRSRTRLD